jgi:hypothetical protein
MREYWIESSVQRSTSRSGYVSWCGTCHVTDGDRGIDSQVRPFEQIAVLSSRGRMDIGEPWPDPTTPVGLSRLLAIAEGLAVTEWEKRFGGAKS